MKKFLSVDLKATRSKNMAFRLVDVSRFEMQVAKVDT